MVEKNQKKNNIWGHLKHVRNSNFSTYKQYFIKTQTSSFIRVLSVAVCALVAELSSHNRDQMAYKTKIFTLWYFTKKKFANPCYKPY